MDEVITAIHRAIIKRGGNCRNDINFNLWRKSEGETNTQGCIAVARSNLRSRFCFQHVDGDCEEARPTLEDVVRETLRPMLKSWLDEHLPSLVERMVEAEIERVTRGR